MTLGIYGAWALVRSKRYFYSRTELSGSRFSYNATGGTIFVSWLCLLIYIIAIEGALIGQNMLTALVLGAMYILFAPYLIVQSLRYQMQSTTLNNVRLNFKCSGLKAWWVMLGCPLLLILGVILVCYLIKASGRLADLYYIDRTISNAFIMKIAGLLGFGVAQGVSTALGLNLLFNHLSFGKQKFAAKIGVKKCINICVVSILAAIPFILILVPAYLKLAVMALWGDPYLVAETVIETFHLKLFICYSIFFVGFLFSYGYLHVTLRNYYFKQVILGEKIAFRSTLTIKGFFAQMAINALLTFCTLGFGYPWARVRYCHYLAQNTWVDGDLDALDLQDHDDKIATDIVSRISRGLVI